MKTKNNNNSAVPSHIESEDMVAYLDGEMDRELQTQVTEHFESCWDCRSRLGSVERSIENFLQLRQNQLLPPELPPSERALDLFRQRLSAHSVLEPSHSLFRLSNFRLNLRPFLKALGLENYSQVLFVRAAAAIVVVVIVTSLV